MESRKPTGYGRTVPKEAHGSVNLGRFTSSTRIILDAVTELYERIVNPKLYVRRLYVIANHVMNPSDVPQESAGEQLDLFFDAEADEREKEEENRALEREKSVQHAVLDIKKKFGKNAILRGMNLEEGSTAKERNGQVGGHKA